MSEKSVESFPPAKAAPAVSIVMPLYNKEAYVGYAIQSVLRQTYGEFELIVVNDGSTDSSLKAASSVEDSRVKVIDGPNRGVALARNRGVESSSAELIAFIDADDVWFDRHVETLVEAARRFPAAGIFANRYVDTLSPSSLPQVTTYSVCPDYPCASLKGGPQMWTSAVMLRRDVFSATGGFPSGESHGEDMAVWMRASMIAPVVFSNYVGAYYRRTGDGLAATLITGPDAFMKALDDLVASGESSQEVRDCLSAHKAKIALAHALTAFMYGRKDVASQFVGMAKALGYWRHKVLLFRGMSYLPSRVSAMLVKLYAAI